MINWHGASGAVRACERYGPFVPFPQNITTADLAAFRGARRSRMDRAKPSFATLLSVFSRSIPPPGRQTRRQIHHPESGGVSRSKRPRLSRKMFLRGAAAVGESASRTDGDSRAKGQKDRENTIDKNKDNLLLENKVFSRVQLQRFLIKLRFWGQSFFGSGKGSIPVLMIPGVRCGRLG